HVDIVKLFHDLPPELWHWVDKGFAPINLTHVCQVGRSSIMSTKSNPLHVVQNFKGSDQSEKRLHGSTPSHGAQTMARQTPATADHSGQAAATPSWTRWIKAQPETR
ncbi:hypothetical protein, partial [Limnohabitans sp. 2KL-51]|uniref:hypothetical protein n=1 Tax=Limnohabitans sp. 2KL-51 TaxID=1977911 RepID=UPI001E63F282